MNVQTKFSQSLCYQALSQITMTFLCLYPMFHYFFWNPGWFNIQFHAIAKTNKDYTDLADVSQPDTPSLRKQAMLFTDPD